MKKLILGALFWFAASTAAYAQSCPTFSAGQVLTAGQWQACFDAKQNALGYTPLNRAGDTMLGRLGTAASTASAAGLNVPAGAAPTSPVDGDVWTTTAGIFVRINGGTVGPLGTGVVGTLAVTSGGTGAASFTANLPLIGNGTSALAQGTRSGNTTKFVTTTGTLTNGDCVQIDSNGNFVAAGGSCTTGGGGGTVNAGTANQLAYYQTSTNAVVGLSSANNGVLITSGAGVPSISSTIPSATQDNITRTGILVAGTASSGFTVALASATLTGALPAANMPALTGDITSSAGSVATTLASVITAGGPTGSATAAPVITYDAKGRLTAVSSATITPAESSVTFTDITTNDVSTSKHGYAPKAPNDATKYLDGTAAYSVPPQGYKLLCTYSASSSATIDIVNGVDGCVVDSTYDAYQLVISGANAATDAVEAWIRYRVAGSFNTGSNYTWTFNGGVIGSGLFTGSASDTKIKMSYQSSNLVRGANTGTTYNATFNFSRVDQSSVNLLYGTGGYTRSEDVDSVAFNGSGSYTTSTAITGVRFQFSSGAIAAGRFSWYGLKKSWLFLFVVIAVPGRRGQRSAA